MNVEGTFLTDQNSNLSRDCRQFYERRVMMAESASKHWHAIEAEITFGTVRRNKAGTIVRSRTQDEDNEPFVRLPLKIAQLRRELLSLVNLDNELFKNLLTLHDTIEEIREQQTRHKIKKDIVDKPVLKPVLKPISKPYVAEEDEDLEHLEWPLSFEEAQMFASLPVVPTGYNNNYTKTLPNASRRRRLESQEETSGAMKFVLRSKSFLMRQPFQRKHISFPATKQNRMKEENVQNQQTLTRKTSEPNDLRAPFTSLNISGSTSHVATRPATTHQQILHLPPSRFLWQKMFPSLGSNTNGPESLPCRWMASDDGGFGDKAPLSLNHMKQSSFDSGIHGSDSEFSVKV